jgi:integrase
MQGHIAKRTRKAANGKTTTRWYVVIDIGRDENGKRKQKWLAGFSTRKEAEAERAKAVNELHLGSYVAPSKLTLNEWLTEHWLPSMRTQVKAGTWDSYNRNIRLHVVPKLGAKVLKDISPQLLNHMYADLLEGTDKTTRALSPKTVRYIHTTIHKSLADAVDAGMLANNPAERAKPPRPRAHTSDRLNYWTPKELRSFLSHVAGTRLEAAWHLAALTGMRRGEVLGLRWSDIDFESQRLSVRNTLVSVNYRLVESTPKNHKARVVDLDTVTAQRLRDHRLRQESECKEWGSEYHHEDRVFCREDGSPLHPDSFSQRFELEVRRADLRKIRLHDLRHTHATIALKAGVPVKVISERLGHESPAFTLRQYAHVIPGMQAEAAQQIASLVSGQAFDVTTPE